jgi:hypothetical protein
MVIDLWVIMDKEKKAIACGSPRNRQMIMLSDLGNIRILTYGSQKRTESAYRDCGFYDETKGYLKEKYGEPLASDPNHIKIPYEKCCMAVKAKLVIEE